MIIQLETNELPVLMIEVVDGLTESDEQLCQKLFLAKLEEGHENVHMLVKLDEAKLTHSSAKAFFEDLLFVIRQYKKMGNIAVVAHSRMLKTLVPIDNFFFERASQGYQERYFDASQMDEAKAFVLGEA